MTQDDGGYDLKNPPPASPPPPSPDAATAKPGDADWVPPVPIIEKADEPEGKVTPEELAEITDIEKNKGMAILAYICFIIPLLAAPTSKFARFHANQGLLTFIMWCLAIVGNIALWAIGLGVDHLFARIDILRGFLNCMIYVAQPLMLVAALALCIYGIIQAANGERKALPVIGQITLIK